MSNRCSSWYKWIIALRVFMALLIFKCPWLRSLPCEPFCHLSLISEYAFLTRYIEILLRVFNILTGAIWTSSTCTTNDQDLCCTQWSSPVLVWERARGAHVWLPLGGYRLQFSLQELSAKKHVCCLCFCTRYFWNQQKIRNTCPTVSHIKHVLYRQ